MHQPPRATSPLAAVLGLALVVPVACNEDEPAPPSGEATETPSEGSRSSASSSAKPLPAIEIPAEVPAEAAGVLILRTPASMFATISSFEFFGEPQSSDTKALREELDEFLEERTGLTLTEVDRVTAFFVPREGFAAVIEGVRGEPKGTPTGEHEGVALFALGDGSMVAAMPRAKGGLVIGEEAAVKLAISCAKGSGKKLRDGGPLHDLLTDDSKNVSLAAAVDIGQLPRDLRREIEGLGLQHGALRYGAEGIALTVTGDEADMEKLATMAQSGIDMMLSEAERNKERAKAGGDTMEGVAAIYAHHSMQRLEKTLQPKQDGGRLTIEVPIRMNDPAMLTAFAGIGAAIAVPALTKYMRRSKTSEARVQIAKMFDAASAYFNEEHVSRGSFSVLGGGGVVPAGPPHQCPNNGVMSSHAGITPPLSVNCNEGPGGRCIPVAGTPSGPGEYPISLWTDNPVWNGLNFQMEQGHAFHYDFRYTNEAGYTGFGQCQFTAQAFADLDDDGLFSTYERAGAADHMGVNAAAGLYIDNEVE